MTVFKYQYPAMRNSPVRYKMLQASGVAASRPSQPNRSDRPPGRSGSSVSPQPRNKVPSPSAGASLSPGIMDEALGWRFLHPITLS